MPHTHAPRARTQMLVTVLPGMEAEGALDFDGWRTNDNHTFNPPERLFYVLRHQPASIAECAGDRRSGHMHTRRREKVEIELDGRDTVTFFERTQYSSMRRRASALHPGAARRFVSFVCGRERYVLCDAVRRCLTHGSDRTRLAQTA